MLAIIMELNGIRHWLSEAAILSRCISNHCILKSLLFHFVRNTFLAFVYIFVILFIIILGWYLLYFYFFLLFSLTSKLALPNQFKLNKVIIYQKLWERIMTANYINFSFTSNFSFLLNFTCSRPIWILWLKSGACNLYLIYWNVNFLHRGWIWL